MIDEFGPFKWMEEESEDELSDDSDDEMINLSRNKHLRRNLKRNKLSLCIVGSFEIYEFCVLSLL